MFSDTVYLFGEKFAPEAKMLDFKEELLNGAKVNQKDLAQMAVFAAFAYLYKEGLVDLFVHEGKILFIKTKTAKAKKLKDSAKPLGGIEGMLLRQLTEEKDISNLVILLLSTDVQNPWGSILSLVKDNLLERGIIKKVEKGKVLFITTHKNILSGDIPKEEKQDLDDLENATKQIKAKGELYDKVLSSIKGGIQSRLKQQRDRDFN